MGLILTSTEREQMTNIHLANYIKDKWIDRLYCTLHGKVYLIQKDGSEYDGAIGEISILGKSGKTRVRFTEDGRWFDQGGMPIDKPASVDAVKEINRLKAENDRKKREAKFEAYKKSLVNNLKGDK